MGRSLTDFKGREQYKHYVEREWKKEDQAGPTASDKQKETKASTRVQEPQSQSLWTYTHLSLQRPPAPITQLPSSHPSRLSSNITYSELPGEPYLK